MILLYGPRPMTCGATCNWRTRRVGSRRPPPHFHQEHYLGELTNPGNCTQKHQLQHFFNFKKVVWTCSQDQFLIGHCQLPLSICHLKWRSKKWAARLTKPQGSQRYLKVKPQWIKELLITVASENRVRSGSHLSGLSWMKAQRHPEISISDRKVVTTYDKCFIASSVSHLKRTKQQQL